MTDTPASADRLRPRSATPLLLAVAAAMVVGLGGFLAYYVAVPAARLPHEADLGRYHDTSSNMLHGLVPYRDFGMEYPPAAVIAYLLPRLVPMPLDPPDLTYALAFAASGIVLMLLSLLAALRVRRATLAPATAPVEAAAFVAAGAVLLGPVLLFRYDTFPAALTILALWATVRRRAATSGVLIAVGVLAKLFPLVLIPLFVAFHLADRDRRSLRRFLVGGSACGLGIVIPCFVLAPRWLRSFVGYHLGRGVQIETLPSSLYLLAAKLGLGRVDVAFNYGAHHVTAPGMHAVGLLLPLLTVASLLTIYWLAYRRFAQERAADGAASADTLALATFLCLLAFILCNKVLSPQYLVWLVPLFALLPRRSAVLMLVACGLSTTVFPPLYERLVAQDALPVVLLLCRNLVLAAVFVLCFRRLAVTRRGRVGT